MRGEYCQIAPDVKLGRDVDIYHFVNLYGCQIGDGTRIGSFVEVQKGVSVGGKCKVSSHTFICEGATIAGGALQTESDWTVSATVVKQGASIGTGATILAGVEICARAIVGAGAVVTKDVPAGVIVAG